MVGGLPRACAGEWGGGDLQPVYSLEQRVDSFIVCGGISHGETPLAGVIVEGTGTWSKGTSRGRG